MTTKIRKQIYIEPEQEQKLKQLASLTGLSEAEIVRQAIQQHRQPARLTTRNLEAWEAERAFIQSLIDQGPVDGGRRWKRDELYDR